MVELVVFNSTVVPLGRKPKRTMRACVLMGDVHDVAGSYRDEEINR